MRINMGYRDQAALVNWYYLELAETYGKNHPEHEISNTVPKTLYMLILEKTYKGDVHFWEKWYQCLEEENNANMGKKKELDEIYQKNHGYIVIEENYNDTEVQLKDYLPIVTGFLMCNLETTELEMAAIKFVAYFVFGLDEKSEGNKQYYEELLDKINQLIGEDESHQTVAGKFREIMNREFHDFYEKFAMNISKEMNTVMEKMAFESKRQVE